MEKPKIYLETTMFSFYYGQETFGGIGVMKTVEDYMNDPRITGDPGLMSGPEEIRTIHAIRLKQHDETAGMSFEEQTAFHRKRADAMFARLGLPLPEYVNYAGQGRLKP